MDDVKSGKATSDFLEEILKAGKKPVEITSILKDMVNEERARDLGVS
ncbi:MAG: hypothetical protein HQK57_16810 [Deltaproteobacteria bacterium]|nr:hypothetical protein [Deltaproteobacteria bacterium]MBF0523663.1 hypothetical protein [Deltaproteobacteria bacterium]